MLHRLKTIPNHKARCFIRYLKCKDTNNTELHEVQSTTSLITGVIQLGQFRTMHCHDFLLRPNAKHFTNSLTIFKHTEG